MAKKKEQELAMRYFVDFYKSQKEIAEDLGVTEKTVSAWVTKYNWKALRDAKLNNSTNRAENIKKVIGELTDSTLDIIEQIKEAESKGDISKVLSLKKETTRIAQEIGMFQKALEKLDKDFKISLTTYMEIMEEIFESLLNFDRELYFKTIPFQKAHLQKVANKLG